MISLMRAAGAAALLVTATVAPRAFQGAPQKFAYVDTRKILDQAPGRPEAEAVLSKEYSTLQDQLKKMNEAVVKSFTEYQNLPPTTAQAEKDRRLKLVQDKQAEMQQKDQEYQTQISQHRDELLQPILDQIKIVLEDLRVEGSWTMIFDVGQGASIVAADKNLDLSDRAIAKLRTMPKPVIAASKADSTKKPAGAPLNAPAGVRPPGTPPPAAKRPDSTAKKPDSTAGKKPDSVTKRPPAGPRDDRMTPGA
jgi:Skp family chaperone for outer membrane proteins